MELETLNEISSVAVPVVTAIIGGAVTWWAAMRKARSERESTQLEQGNVFSKNLMDRMESLEARLDKHDADCERKIKDAVAEEQKRREVAIEREREDCERQIKEAVRQVRRDVERRFAGSLDDISDVEEL